MKRLILAALALLCPCAWAQYATLTGTIQGSNGLTANNYTINFRISQLGFIAGTGAVLNSSTFCATSDAGQVVGLPDPLTPSVVTPAFFGTLPAGNYYVEYAFYNNSGTYKTLVSPETIANLTATGELQVAAPVSGIPAGATGMAVYIGTSSGSETLQGLSTGSGPFIQNVPLSSGSIAPSTNTTVCSQVANDAIWPVGTGYLVSLTDTSGNTLPGYPMMWQLLGPNTTINLSNGLPYYHGVVTYPVPILAAPLNHGVQSISGPLNLTNYTLQNALKVGVGTSLPAYSIDVQNGAVNSTGGYLINGAPVVPSVGTTATGQAVCQYAAGPPVVLGHCTSAVNSSGACTCVN